MQTFDLPLSKLRTYRGTNPKPADFDAFWDRGLKEMRALDPEVEIKPNKTIRSNFADCFDLYFTGVGGSRIHSKLMRPKKSSSPQPALFMFHGYSVASSDWSDKLGYVASGFTVANMDCRGQGGSSEDRGGVTGTTLRGHFIRGLDDKPENLLFRQIFLDTAQLVRIVASLPGVDPHRMGALGGSQGGGLTLACAALAPEIKRIAPIHPFLSDYQRVWELDLAKGAYEELTYYFRQFDPHHNREKEIFTRLGYIDVHHLAPRIKAEVLMGVTLADTICPPSTQFAAFNNVRHKKKKMVLYHDFAHEHIPHFDDMIYEFMRGM